MQYLDLNIRIEKGQDGIYPVILSHQGGEVHGQLKLPVAASELPRLITQMETVVSTTRHARPASEGPAVRDPQAVRSFMQQLSAELLSGEVGEQYRLLSNQAHRDRDGGVRLRLRILAPELAALPWELLYDAGKRCHLAVSSRSPIVRDPAVGHQHEDLTVSGPLRILAMIANPTDQHQLNVEHERTLITDAVKAMGDGVELVWVDGGTPKALQATLRKGPWHIFHYIGHGVFDGEEGGLALENRNGTTFMMSASQLATLLEDERELRLAVLNACEGAQGNTRDALSSVAATLVWRRLPAVVAMQYPISDDAAIEFASTFYQALADRRPVDSALSEAREAMSLLSHTSLEWATPVLYLHAPDGAIFGSAEQQQDETAQPAQPSVDKSRTITGGNFAGPVNMGDTTVNQTGGININNSQVGEVIGQIQGDYVRGNRYEGSIANSGMLGGNEMRGTSPATSNPIQSGSGANLTAGLRAEVQRRTDISPEKRTRIEWLVDRLDRELLRGQLADTNRIESDLRALSLTDKTSALELLATLEAQGAPLVQALARRLNADI